MSLGDVIRVGRCADYGVNQSGLGIHLMVDLHANAPLVALLGPMHVEVALMMAYRWYLCHFFKLTPKQQGCRLFGQSCCAWVKTSDIGIYTNVMRASYIAGLLGPNQCCKKGDMQHDLSSKRQTCMYSARRAHSLQQTLLPERLGSAYQKMRFITS